MKNQSKKIVFLAVFVSVFCLLAFSPIISFAEEGESKDATGNETLDLNDELSMRGEYNVLDNDFWKENSDQPFVIAKEDVTEKAEKAEEGAEEPLSPECAEFAKNPNADLGKVLKAGCKPTLAQMSALMDNPLGNVAMLFTQFDVYSMENPANDKEATKSVYTGILQFPKKLSENWSIINRIVWTVPSMPLDQDKIDAAGGGEYGEGPGATLPPSDIPAPIDLFDGRTTGFGDMYYVGLFTPKEGIKLKNGANFLWGVGFDAGFPTASEDILGTGKWTAGPSALGVYMGPKWKIGGLVQHAILRLLQPQRHDVDRSCPEHHRQLGSG
jgi:hypothetical protein